MNAFSIFVCLGLLLLENATGAAFCSTRMNVDVIPTARISTVSTIENGYYTSNTETCWIFVPGPDKQVMIEFLQLDTELNYDFVQVHVITWYDEIDNTVELGPKLLALSGKKELVDLSSAIVKGAVNQALMITLSTDSNFNSFKGFRAKVSATWRDCYSGMQFISPVYGAPPIAFSDGYPEYLPSLALCWVLSPREFVEFIELSFSAFQTELYFDFVEVHVISSFDLAQRKYTSSALLGQYSGIHLPPVIQGPNNQALLVSFRSDFSIQSFGFAATAEAKRPSTMRPSAAPTQGDCSGGIVDFKLPPKQVISFDNSQPNRVCYVLRPTALNGKVQFKFTTAGLVMGPQDYVQIVGVSQAPVVPGQPLVGTRMIRTFLPGTVKKGYNAKIGEIMVVQVVRSNNVNGILFQATLKEILPVATKSPTPQVTLAPTPLDGASDALTCQTVMDVYDAESEGQTFFITELFDSYPANYHPCFVVKSWANHAIQFKFVDFQIADDEVLVFPIEAFNAQTRTFQGRGPVVGITALNQVYTAPVGKTVLIAFNTNAAVHSTGFAVQVDALAQNKAEEIVRCECKQQKKKNLCVACKGCMWNVNKKCKSV